MYCGPQFQKIVSTVLVWCLLPLNYASISDHHWYPTAYTILGFNAQLLPRVLRYITIFRAMMTCIVDSSSKRIA